MPLYLMDGNVNVAVMSDCVGLTVALSVCVRVGDTPLVRDPAGDGDGVGVKVGVSVGGLAGDLLAGVAGTRVNVGVALGVGTLTGAGFAPELRWMKGMKRSLGNMT